MIFRRGDAQVDELEPPDGVSVDEWAAVPDSLRPYYRPQPELEDQVRAAVFAGVRKRPLVMHQEQSYSFSGHDAFEARAKRGEFGGAYRRDELPGLIRQLRLDAAADAYRDTQVIAESDALIRGFDRCEVCGAGNASPVPVMRTPARLCARCAVSVQQVLGELCAADAIDDDGTTRAQPLRKWAARTSS